MPASLGCVVDWYYGIPEFTAVRSTVCMVEERVSCFYCCMFCEVKLYLVVVSIVVLSHPILCPVVREWWAGADCMWEKSVRLCSKSQVS